MFGSRSVQAPPQRQRLRGVCAEFRSGNFINFD